MVIIKINSPRWTTIFKNATVKRRQETKNDHNHIMMINCMFKRTSFAKGSLLQDHMIINECKYDLLTKYLACLTMLNNLR